MKRVVVGAWLRASASTLSPLSAGMFTSNSTRSGFALRTRLDTPSDERWVRTSKPYALSVRSSNMS